ncbi:MAG: recombinase family protein, partial [Ruminococcus flavefaciens]|nr:recombinase family protein [Ruminococcus flavefaciens]
AQGGESSSITNQRMIVENYCKQNGITLVREFVDDGYSGGNFDRPGFKEMLKQLEQGKANLVITKDLSRLGRDMREASYYAEQFFPEHGVKYIAIADNFDTDHDNIMAPFLFAMNEVYLRDGSRKVKDVLRNKRENGQYCACPPYGYRKDPENKHRLTPDEMTAQIIDADISSPKYKYILNSAFSGKRYLIGDFGTGKSHALTILAQQLANNYLNDINNPLPLFIQAKELSRIGSVQQWIDSLNIGSSSYFLLIDGLDEVDSTSAAQMVEDINILAVSYPQSKIIVSSRPLFATSKSGKTFEILSLTAEEWNALYNSIIGDSSSNFAFHHLDPQMNSLLSRPFFCVIYALFKSEPKSWAKTDMDLVSAFIKRALLKVEDQASVFTDLSAIAAKSISKNLGDVHISEIWLTGTLDNLLKTGFISLTDDYLSFSLPIIGQWMAAEAIRRKVVQISSIIDNRSNATCWLYPFSILFNQMSFEESLEYFLQIVLKMPDIAARVIRDGIRFGTLRSALTANECGKMIQ